MMTRNGREVTGKMGGREVAQSPKSGKTEVGRRDRKGKTVEMRTARYSNILFVS